MMAGTEVLHGPQADPWWVGAVPALERTRVDGYADGWTFTAPVIEMPVYCAGWRHGLPAWRHGHPDEPGRLPESRLTGAPVLVVNCAGIGRGCWRRTSP